MGRSPGHEWAGVPDPITPEMSIHGPELVSVSVRPELRAGPEQDLYWKGDLVRLAKDTYLKLKKIRVK